ncbi:hypothetical protein V5799_024294 [Amblyomma americanum]|uniref:Neuropeptide-like protein 29 n=2 Tax=Amblyomma americanum TaxID=6943 RepID=A0AAQ4ED07_AMBAM
MNETYTAPLPPAPSRATDTIQAAMMSSKSLLVALVVLAALCSLAAAQYGFGGGFGRGYGGGFGRGFGGYGGYGRGFGGGYGRGFGGYGRGFYG